MMPAAQRLSFLCAVLLVKSVGSWAPLVVRTRISLPSLRRSCCPRRSEFAFPSSLRCQLGFHEDFEKGVADVSDTSAAFARWMDATGTQRRMFRRIALADFNGLRGAMTERAIAKGETLLAYPRTTTMDLRTVEGCPCSDLVDPSYWESAPWFLQLGLWLIAEELKGSSSPWAEYIATLPKDDGVMEWTSEELALLGSPSLFDSIMKQKEDFRALLEATRSHLKRADAIDRLEWAMVMVLSRANSSPDRDSVSQLLAQTQTALAKNATQFMPKLTGLEEEAKPARACMALAPMWDILNHLPEATTEYTYNPDTDTFVLVAAKDHFAGEQCFNSYGDFNNDHLLQYYNFICPNNPHDDYQLTDFDSWLLNACDHPRAAKAQHRLRSVHQAGLLSSLQTAQVAWRFSSGAWVDAPTLQALRAFAASEEELDQLTAAGFTQALSVECERAAVEVLCAFLQHVETQMAASQHADERVFQEAAEPERASVSKSFRAEKRNLVASAVVDLLSKIERLA